MAKELGPHEKNQSGKRNLTFFQAKAAEEKHSEAVVAGPEGQQGGSAPGYSGGSRRKGHSALFLNDGVPIVISPFGGSTIVPRAGASKGVYILGAYGAIPITYKTVIHLLRPETSVEQSLNLVAWLCSKSPDILVAEVSRDDIAVLCNAVGQLSVQCRAVVEKYTTELNNLQMALSRRSSMVEEHPLPERHGFSSIERIRQESVDVRGLSGLTYDSPFAGSTIVPRGGGVSVGVYILGAYGAFPITYKMVIEGLSGQKTSVEKSLDFVAWLCGEDPDILAAEVSRGDLTPLCDAVGRLSEIQRNTIKEYIVGLDNLQMVLENNYASMEKNQLLSEQCVLSS